jgi:hypothetical protein
LETTIWTEGIANWGQSSTLVQSELRI